MSFFTGQQYFTTSENIDNGPNLYVWTNVGNVLAEPGSSDIRADGVDDMTDILSVRTPKSTDEIPGGVPFAAGVEILAVSVQLDIKLDWTSNDESTYVLTGILLGNAALPDLTFIKSTSDGLRQLITMGGTLVALGMTQQDAEDFADGTTDFRLYIDSSDLSSSVGRVDTSMYGVKSEFEYNYTGGGGEAVGVQVPRLF